MGLTRSCKLQEDIDFSFSHIKTLNLYIYIYIYVMYIFIYAHMGYIYIDIYDIYIYVYTYICIYLYIYIIYIYMHIGQDPQFKMILIIISVLMVLQWSLQVGPCGPRPRRFGYWWEGSRRCNRGVVRVGLDGFLIVNYCFNGYIYAWSTYCTVFLGMTYDDMQEHYIIP